MEALGQSCFFCLLVPFDTSHARTLSANCIQNERLEFEHTLVFILLEKIYIKHFWSGALGWLSHCSMTLYLEVMSWNPTWGIEIAYKKKDFHSHEGFILSNKKL